MPSSQRLADEGEVAVGRPPKLAQVWETPEAVARACDEYLERCRVESTPATITGLCVHLEIAPDTWEETIRAEDGEGEDARAPFSGVLKRARARIQAGIEALALTSGKPIGAIAWLNANAGWRQGVDVTTGGRALDMRGLFARASAANAAKDAAAPADGGDGEGDAEG